MITGKIHSINHPWYKSKHITTCGRSVSLVRVTMNEYEVTCKYCKGGGIAAVRKVYFDNKLENQLEFLKP